VSLALSKKERIRIAALSAKKKQQAAVSGDDWRGSVASLAEKVSAGRWVRYRHLDYISDVISAAIKKGGARIIVNMPPRNGKSEFCSKYLPIWALDADPTNKVMIASYRLELAKRWSRQIRDIIKANAYLNCKVSQSSSSASQWSTADKKTGLELEGGLTAAGVDGGIIGFGADVLVIDDPIKNNHEGYSPLYQAKLRDWFLHTAYTRLEPGGSVVVVMQRWSDIDFVDFLINKHGDDWTVINLPAICEDDNDPLGRAIGDALFPERFDADALAKIRVGVSELVWQAMYQQRPSSLVGNIIKREWIKFFTEMPTGLESTIHSWDLTFSDTGPSLNDGQVWGSIGDDSYLLDNVGGNWRFVETMKNMIELASKYPNYAKVLVENKANGPAIEDMLKKKVDNILLWPPKGQRLGSKVERLESVSPYFKSGNVHAPDPLLAPWVVDWLEQVCNFPAVRNDDKVDTTTQALLYLRNRGNAGIVSITDKMFDGNNMPNDWNL